MTDDADDTKLRLAEEESTKNKASLTQSDRRLLNCYFGFTACRQIAEFPRRRLRDASSYVRKMLSDGDDENLDNATGEKQQKQQQHDDEYDNKNEPFDLANLLDGNMPTIFESNMDDLIRIFREGSTFTDKQMEGALRTYSAFSRLYPQDLAVSNGYTRILLIGPVSMKKNIQTVVTFFERQTD